MIQLYQASAHDIFYIIWSAILRRSSEFIQYTITVSHDILWMIRLSHGRNHWFWNDAFHEPILGHQLNILWQYAVSDLYIFGYQWVNISLGSILERFAWRSKVDNSEILIFVKCGFLPSSCISQFVIMEIIYKHCHLRIEDLSHSLR